MLLSCAIRDPNTFRTCTMNENPLIPSYLREILAKCHSRLKECCKLREFPAVQHWAEGRMIDFNLWAAGVGAYAAGANSLELRLKLSGETLDVLKRLLGSVEVALGTIVNDIHLSKLPEPGRGESTKLPQSKQGEGPTVSFTNADHVDESLVAMPSLGSRMSELFADVEALMECLFDLGHLIKEAGRSSRLRRADQSFSKNNYSELGKHLEVLLQSKMNAEWYLPSKEITASVLSIKLSPGQYNLIEANLRRRHRFTQARQRFDQNSSPGAGGGEESSPEVDEQKEIVTSDQAKTQEQDITRSHADPVPKSRRKGQPKVAFTASTLDLEMLKRKIPDTARGENEGTRPKAAPTVPMTAITAEVAYPKPPATAKSATAKNEKNRAFSCPCCYETLEIATTGSTDKWK